MKAAIIEQFGGPEVFKIDTLAKPEIKSNQILIKVYASSINPIDWKQRKGNHKFILGSPFPIVLGYDVAGEIVEIGKEIRKFNIGDKVFGVLNNKYGGALAEYAIGQENNLVQMPANISKEEAAAFPMVALTALQALRDKANLKVGQTILINGASGGVGHLAIQVAKLMQAKVIAVASSKSESFIKQFEPDEFIDYSSQSIVDLDKKVDVFFDVFGNYTFPKVKHLLNPGGIYINSEYINTLKKMPLYKLHQLFSKGKKAKSILLKHNSNDLEIIKNWIEEGKLKVAIDEVFSLNNISAAHDYAQLGHSKGKNVIIID